ncbi:putative Cell division control protein [Helianthus debilis subsp. tardiflorus]
MDPLTALREMTIQNKLDQIVRVNNEYRFNSTLSFPCTIETAYRSKQGNLYTLETLVYFITNLHIKHHDYIQDGVFIPTDVKMKGMKGPKPECVTVLKKFSSRDRVVTAYEVRDKPSALKAEEWGRVVAVFVLGKEWQFKDWPFKDHVEIFNKILGFYMRFEDDSVESAKIVKQWNVKIISISKNKRHQDRAAALDVWDRLEEFVRSRSRS